MDENGRRDAFSNPANGGLQGSDWVTIFTYLHYETYTFTIYNFLAIIPENNLKLGYLRSGKCFRNENSEIHQCRTIGPFMDIYVTSNA
jgi:hypothetical protein